MNFQLHFRYHTNESIDDVIDDDDDSQLFKYHPFEWKMWFCFRNHIYIVKIELLYVYLYYYVFMLDGPINVESLKLIISLIQLKITAKQHDICVMSPGCYNLLSSHGILHVSMYG